MSKIKTKTIKDLIPIFGQNIEQESMDTVNARDVWKFLEVKKDFSDWIKDKIKNYDFIEGQDYVCSPFLGSKEGKDELIIDNQSFVGGRNIKEYYISFDMAKELSMVQNNPKGKEARQYFIQCEKIAKEAIIREARQFRREGNREYKQLKANNTAARRIGTDAIQRWVDYALSQGTKNPDRWYGLLTEAQYDALVVPGGHMEIRRRKKELKKKNGHDVLTNEELLSLTIMNLAFTGKAIDESLAIGGDYHKNSPMLNLVKEKFNQYGQMINDSFLLQNNTKKLILQDN